jgi:hypothetical protein
MTSLERLLVAALFATSACSGPDSDGSAEGDDAIADHKLGLGSCETSFDCEPGFVCGTDGSCTKMVLEGQCKPAEPSVDPAVAEQKRQDYFRELQAAALGQLAANRKDVDTYLAVYQDPSKPGASQVIDLQRARFRSYMAIQRQLAGFVSKAESDAREADVFQQSLRDYYHPAQRANLILIGLQAHGFIVIRGKTDLSGSPVNLRDGRPYLDLDKDVQPVLDWLTYRKQYGNMDCFDLTRLGQIGQLRRRELEKKRAMLAMVSPPILDVKIGGILGFFASTIGTIAEDASKSAEDFRRAMIFGLGQIGTNISAEQSRVGALTIADARELARIPLVRVQVLAAHPEFADIDSVVLNEFHLSDVPLWIASTAAMVMGFGFQLLKHPLLMLVMYTGSLAINAVIAKRAYQEYWEAEQEYFTAVEGAGLVSKEYLLREGTAFTAALVNLILSALVTFNSGWQVLRLAEAARAAGAEVVLADALARVQSGELGAREFLDLVDSIDPVEDYLEWMYKGYKEVARVPASIQQILTNAQVITDSALPVGPGWTWEQYVKEALEGVGPGHVGELDGAGASRPLFTAAAVKNGGSVNYWMFLMPNGRVRYISEVFIEHMRAIGYGDFAISVSAEDPFSVVAPITDRIVQGGFGYLPWTLAGANPQYFDDLGFFLKIPGLPGQGIPFSRLLGFYGLF